MCDFRHKACRSVILLFRSTAPLDLLVMATRCAIGRRVDLKEPLNTPGSSLQKEITVDSFSQRHCLRYFPFTCTSTRTIKETVFPSERWFANLSPRPRNRKTDFLKRAQQSCD